MDILNSKKLLKFGKYNYWLLNITKGNKIFHSMMHKRIQHFNVNNCILIIVKPEYIVKDTITKRAHAGEQLPPLEFMDKGKGVLSIIRGARWENLGNPNPRMHT